MLEVNGRLICCTCGADLGSATDPYRDPNCERCAWPDTEKGPELTEEEMEELLEWERRQWPCE